jgi:hypothetical protein
MDNQVLGGMFGIVFGAASILARKNTIRSDTRGDVPDDDPAFRQASFMYVIWGSA